MYHGFSYITNKDYFDFIAEHHSIDTLENQLVSLNYTWINSLTLGPVAQKACKKGQNSSK